MLPTDWTYGDWPKSGEIDIMEHVGYDPDVIHITAHTEAYYFKINTRRKQVLKKYRTLLPTTMYTGWTGRLMPCAVI